MVATAILVVNLVLAAPQALKFLTTRVDRIGEIFGVFSSPIALPLWLWLNITLALAGAVAGVDRALTLRRNRLLDLETLWWVCKTRSRTARPAGSTNLTRRT